MGGRVHHRHCTPVHSCTMRSLALFAAALVVSAAADGVNCTGGSPLDAKLSVTLINGTTTNLGALAGKATLIANTASF